MNLLMHPQNFLLRSYEKIYYYSGEKTIVKSSSNSSVVSRLILLKSESQHEKYWTALESIKILRLRVGRFTYFICNSAVTHVTVSADCQLNLCQRWLLLLIIYAVFRSSFTEAAISKSFQLSAVSSRHCH